MFIFIIVTIQFEIKVQIKEAKHPVACSAPKTSLSSMTRI